MFIVFTETNCVKSTFVLKMYCVSIARFYVWLTILWSQFNYPLCHWWVGRAGRRVLLNVVPFVGALKRAILFRQQNGPVYEPRKRNVLPFAVAQKRSMEKQRGMAFGFWKMAIAVKNRSDRYIHRWMNRISRLLIFRVHYISSVHVKRCIPLLLLLSVSPEITSFRLKSDVRLMCPNYLFD